MRWVEGTNGSPANLNKLANSATSAYTIYIQDGQAIAESNMPSGTDYDSGSDITVINNAITATGADGGGTVFLKKGSFNTGATSVLMDQTKVNLIGDGMGTILYTNSDAPLITVPRPAAQINGQIIGNFALKGPGYTNTSAHGFDCNNPFYLIIQNVYASDVRDVLNFVEGDYVTVRNVHAQPITEWATGEHWRFAYLEASGSNGPMIMFDECFSYHARDSGIWIEEVEIARFHRVIVAEPGYGDDAGYSGHGFYVDTPNSYCTFDACEADTTHGHGFYFKPTSAPHHSFIEITDCFSSAKTGYAASALYIEDMNAVKVKGGEWRAVGAEVVRMDSSDFCKLIGLEIRGHNVVPDPGVYYDGVKITDCDAFLVDGCHLQTPYNAAAKSAIYEDTSSYGAINNCRFWSAGATYWAAHINAANTIVSNCPRVNYQTEAGGAWVGPSDTLGNGTQIVMYNSNLGQYRLYTRANAGWHYVALT